MYSTDMSATPQPGAPPVPVFLGNGWISLLSQTYYGHSVALVPFGVVTISAHVPDNQLAGGNARGTGAVDLQTSRGLSSRVASGNYSAIVGGADNTASGTHTVVGGSANTASQTYAVALGQNNTASASGAVALGLGNTVSGTAAAALGQGNTASGNYSGVPWGFQATTRGLTGAYAWAYSQRSALGDAQRIGMTQRVSTSATSAATLTAGGAAASATNVLVLPNNSGAHFVARVMAYRSAGGVGSWRVEGTIERGANAASTALVGATTITTFGISASIGAPTVDVVADTTQGAPVVQVTPANTDATYWVAELVLIQGA